MKKIIIFLILTGLIFVCPCEKTADNVSYKIKILLKATPDVAFVNEFECYNERVYLFGSKSPDSFLSLLDKNGNFLCNSYGGLSGLGDEIYPDFYGKATFIINILPYYLLKIEL